MFINADNDQILSKDFSGCFPIRSQNKFVAYFAKADGVTLEVLIFSLNTELHADQSLAAPYPFGYDPQRVGQAWSLVSLREFICQAAQSAV